MNYSYSFLINFSYANFLPEFQINLECLEIEYVDKSIFICIFMLNFIDNLRL